MKRLILSVSIILGCVSCGNRLPDDEVNNPYKKLNLSTKSSEIVSLSKGFTFNYIDKVNAEATGDYVISPLSMQFLLGMILNGTQGETADEICTVLGYGKGESAAVNEYCLSMLQQLPTLDKKTSLSIANGIFVKNDRPLLDTYKQTVSRYYDAGVTNLDFTDTQATLDAVNGWCSDHTKGLIKKVLEKVDPNEMAYLLNAMYFKSQWTDKFSKSATAQESFTDEAGGKRKVSMMKRSGKYLYSENDIFQAVGMPFGNGAYSMMVLLPKTKHNVADVTATLKKSDWDQLRYSMSTYEVDLWLPSFETKFHIKLNDILSEMGMPSSFNEEKADFGAMSEWALCLSFVQQDALIKVDEEGAEAAVVSSAGVFEKTAAMTEYAVFHADHPFIYLIVEKSSGAVLFAGRYSAK